MSDKNNGSEKENNEISYLAIGAGLGIVFGIICKNLALGLIIGIAIGIAIDYKNTKNK